MRFEICLKLNRILFSKLLKDFIKNLTDEKSDWTNLSRSFFRKVKQSDFKPVNKELILRKYEGNSEFNLKFFPVGHHDVVDFCEFCRAEFGSNRLIHFFNFLTA